MSWHARVRTLGTVEAVFAEPQLNEAPRLTTTAGGPVADNQNSLSAGPRGPLLMRDWQVLEKLAHQSRERMPERVVHAKGWGAFGTFTVTNDVSRYTRAHVFGAPGRQTEIAARFSNVAGELGAADAERDVRGFAVEFYSAEGNRNVVGNTMPVFFVRSIAGLDRAEQVLLKALACGSRNARGFSVGEMSVACLADNIANSMAGVPQGIVARPSQRADGSS